MTPYQKTDTSIIIGFLLVIIFLLVATLIDIAESAPLPIAHLAEQTTCYDTADKAASEALASALRFTDSEYAGAVFEMPDGDYCATEPIGGGRDDSFSIRIEKPPGGKFVALYHTHPGYNTLNELFSPQDIDIAKRLGVASYIGIVRSQSIKRYESGVVHNVSK